MVTLLDDILDKVEVAGEVGGFRAIYGARRSIRKLSRIIKHTIPMVTDKPGPSVVPMSGYLGTIYGVPVLESKWLPKDQLFAEYKEPIDGKTAVIVSLADYPDDPDDLL